MSRKSHPYGTEDCVLWAAERVGRALREEKDAWEQAQWAKNNATFSWKAAAPLRVAESALKRFAGRGQGEPAPAAKGTPVILSGGTDAMLPDADVRLSVVIPTLNAGEDFNGLLRLLREQKGLPSLEIVVVDSGSSDQTVETAQQYGAEVISISKNEFTHAHARNLGAQQATGDYLLFMTQDALPDGETWARRLLQPLLTDTVQAVTCVEVPRPDADLFSRVAAFQYERSLGRAVGADYMGALPAEETYVSMLQNAGLSNVACAMPAATFAKYQFRGRFAEDLDLGVRLIRDGGKIGVLSSVPVVHSHNRPPMYYLKRSCVDVTYVSPILPSMPLSQLSLDEFLFSALGTLKRLVAYNHFLEALEGGLTAEQLAMRSRDFFSGMEMMGYSYRFEEPPAAIDDDALDAVLKTLWRLSLDCKPEEMDFSRAFLGRLEDGAFALLQQQGDSLSEDIYLQICDIVLKYYAMWLGEGLAALARNPASPAPLRELAEDLCQGV